ncbi:hypothetical protein SacmaDRAFT_0973 [Saccharomonospora marina XMU15]|uniref:Pyrrolo-quinoline quinone repeat domain-containing protein n=1 Tax=Saccharomonospora marina XMU15 TaxID=882083 RepID=H5XAA1_9PSEU|nr:PQQ-binding-like beta-propeller repeat protein [Saccharomonospora marina]EHR49266.1 hypothetical protein SacmaDRAFT_0973 [Saccharomonospora marina XMU15]
MNTSPGRPDETDAQGSQAAFSSGKEDVLASGDAAGGREADESHPGGPEQRGHQPARQRRGSKSPWNRPRDRAVAATLAVLALAAAVLVWWFSDSRATTQRTAAAPPPLPAEPASVPAGLSEIWRAPSSATSAPVSEGGLVITAADSAVQGRDPLTGQVRWSYARDLPLCTVTNAWSKVLAVYRKDMGCSEVTQLDAGTGRRTAQRNGDAELGTRLVEGGSHVTTTGDHLLNTWRNDLVKSMEYGRVPAQVNPDRQPRTGCEYGTVAAAADKVGVIEHCPDESGARLTVLKASGEDADKPEQEFSALLPEPDAALVAMADDAVAVAMPEHGRLFVFNGEGRQTATYPLDVPAAELSADPPGGVVATSRGGDNVYWFTGSRTVALSARTLRPLWTVHDTLGPGTLFADEYVVPIEGGLAVLNEADGATLRTVRVDRSVGEGTIRLAAAGPVLLEQRGDTMVALK